MYFIVGKGNEAGKAYNPPLHNVLTTVMYRG